MARSGVKFTISAEDKTKSAFESATRGIRKLEKQFALVTAPIAAFGGAAGLGALIKKTAEMGDMFDKMSQRIGVSVETLSSFGYAAKITGTSIDVVEKSLKYLSNQMLDVSRGTGESKQTFDELGISVLDAQGSLRSVRDVLIEARRRMRWSCLVRAPVTAWCRS